MKNDCIIRLETSKDHAKVEHLVRESFWNVYRPGCLEHYVLHCLREDPAFVPELDFVMEKDGVIIGQHIFVRASIAADDGRSIPILTMGPICIASELKRQGYGKILLDYSLEQAVKLGAGAVCALKATSTSTARAALPMPPATASVITDCRKGRTHPSSCARS